MIKTPHPIKGTNTATGDEVVSRIKASFSLDIFNFLKKEQILVQQSMEYLNQKRR